MKKKSELTNLGKYFIQKSINKAEVFRKTGISESRLSLLCNNSNTRLLAEELHLIALAIEVSPNEIISRIFPDTKLNNAAKQMELAQKGKKK